MAHGSMKLFFVMLFNNTDERDDDMLKIAAKTKPKALAAAKEYVEGRSNFSLGQVYTRKQLQKCQPDWHSLLWGVEPHIEVR